MAVRTSIRSGDWSAAGTWDTGVPLNGDSVVIAAGHTVTFDVDQSGFAAGIAGVTINGTLAIKTNGGPYTLKTSADIVVATTGTFRAGTSPAVPLPSAVKFTLHLNGACKVAPAGNGLVQFYCAEPTTKLVRLSALEAAGQTVLSVDTDVTADLWAAGDTVRIDRVTTPGTDAQSEERVIAAAGIAANAITVTVGLAADKAAGSILALMSRNIRVTGATGYWIDGGTGAYLGAEVSGCTNGVRSGSGHTVSGTISGCTNGVNSGSGHTVSGTISGCTYGVYSGSGYTVSGTISGCTYGAYSGSGYTVSGTISGCTYGAYSGSGHTVSGTISGCTNGVSSGSGHTVSGTISGCTYGVNSGSGYTVSGTISGCTNGVYSGSGYTVSGTISGCTNGVRRGGVDCVGATFVDNATDVQMDGIQVGPLLRVRSFRHNGTATDTRAWSAGGTVTPEAVIVPPGHTVSHKFTGLDGGYWNVMEWEYRTEGPGLIAVQGWAKHDVAGLAADARVHVQILDWASDPLIGGVPLAEWIAPDGTDWQSGMVRYLATDARPLMIRICHKRAAGVAYALAVVRGPGFAGVLQ